MNAKVLLAVFKRNFISYFSNPTGYVFVCVFVALSSIAAFLPDPFWNANLANLAQLNYWFPYIMLVFIPAITMSVWADERRQGTDELLLTIPAGDLEIVLGKYFAAVAIFLSSLLFSLVCNLWVLERLGSPDWGLFMSTYFGYAMVGLLMLAVGMAASFLTSNLTISYILGALMNAPLVVLTWADSTAIDRSFSLGLKQLSISGQLDSFGRGIIGFSQLIYFVALAVVMIYLSMILIGRRHWTATRRTEGTLHFSGRIIALVIAVVSVVVIAQRMNLRVDMTSENINSLSASTATLLEEVKPDSPVRITAFLSPEVPEDYIETKLDIENVLQEIKARGGKKIRLDIIETDLFTEEAELAANRYGIEPRRVFVERGGRPEPQELFLGVAFQCGLDQPIIIPFIDRGVPVEYELIRSICTVSQQERKKIGIVDTPAQVFGSPAMGPMQPGTGPRRIVAELNKMYDVMPVDPSMPIEDEYDALLVVQPSALLPAAMDNLVDAVSRGIPIAVFEDPSPIWTQVPGTSEPLTPNDPMAMYQQPNTEEKGDVGKLLDVLGVGLSDQNIVFQNYNPFPVLASDDFPKEFVFVDTSDPELKGEEAFNSEDVVSSGVQHVVMPFPGTVIKSDKDEYEITPLICTTKVGGTIRFDELMDPMAAMFGQRRLDDRRDHETTNDSYTLASRVRGPIPLASKDVTDREEIHAIVVADVDLLADEFFDMRERGNRPGGLQFDFDNVTFVLNVLDSLADDERFLELRKRRPAHRTLETITARTKEAREEATEEQIAANKAYEDIEATLDQDLADLEAKLSDKFQNQGMTLQEAAVLLQIELEAAQKRNTRDLEEEARERDAKLRSIQTELNKDVSRVRDWFKFSAVVFPPIPPLMIAVLVFVLRRVRESEGVAATRRRKRN
jgi:ABC-2 type transport system permease protein